MPHLHGVYKCRNESKGWVGSSETRHIVGFVNDFMIIFGLYLGVSHLTRALTHYRSLEFEY